MSKPSEAKTACDNVVPFPTRSRGRRADVPTFDPSNPAHVTAWESLWDYATGCKTGGL